MTSKRPVPADMLLVNERRRRLAAGIATPARTAPSDALDADDIFATDEDQLVDEPQAPAQPSPAHGAVVLRKPMSSVTLAHIGWSGPIDHELLQAALACQPVHKRDAAAHAQLFGGQTSPHDVGAALEVVLDQSEIAILSATGDAEPDALVRAAQLADRLTGEGVSASDIVSSVLAAYRRTALSCAWYERLGLKASAQALRERDETAVTMLSTLRALLGER
ncbi:MAG: hypothetical protein JOY87_02615 [Candidatus Eremiobacteraeota bacterium]|nr:hypothetical protein [Candidatus Eremiobacteraeota bacterium]